MWDSKIELQQRVHSPQLACCSAAEIPPKRGCGVSERIKKNGRIPYSRRFPAASLLERSGNPAKRGCRVLQKIAIRVWFYIAGNYSVHVRYCPCACKCI